MQFSPRFVLPSRLPIAALVIAALASVLLSGCATLFEEQRVIAPTDPQAETCVADCDLKQQQCEQRQLLREQECQAQFNRLTTNLAACLATPGALCVRPNACLGADMNVCRVQHEECLIACGGRIETSVSMPGATSR